MIKIIVDTKEERDALIEESAYIHDHINVDTDKCNTLAHLYLLENNFLEIEVKEDE